MILKFLFRLSDGTWIGMVADVSKGLAETSVAGTTATFERKEIVDFTFDFSETQSGLIIQTPSSAQVSHGNYFYEFDIFTWILIGTQSHF